MTDHTVNVAALIGSRICHDLISPVGAVTNGLELLAMSGVGESPELSLVNSSAADASARIRLFRLAFGTAKEGQGISSDELRRILADHYSDGRIQVTFEPSGDLHKKMAKAAVLGVLCVEQSLPFGGELAVQTDGEDWTITGTSQRIKERPDLWAGLTDNARLDDLAPADVQYLLLKVLLDSLGRTARITASDMTVCLTF